jgi:hypothetical protein
MIAPEKSLRQGAAGFSFVLDERHPSIDKLSFEKRIAALLKNKDLAESAWSLSDIKMSSGK